MTISRAGDVAWWQMTKENKLASLVVTFCSLIQIILVLLIAVKNSNQLLCSKHWSIFRRSHLSGINFTTIVREKNIPFHPRARKMLTFGRKTCWYLRACARALRTQSSPGPGPVIGGGLRDTGPSVTARPGPERVTWPLRAGTRGGCGPGTGGDTRRPGPVTWPEDNGQWPGALLR